MSRITLHMGAELTGNDYDIVADWIDRNGTHHEQLITLIISDDQLVVSALNNDERVVESFALGALQA